MSRPRFCRRSRSSSLFLHHAGRDSVGDRAKTALLLQRSPELRPKAASWTPARAARSLCPAHPRLAQSNFQFGIEIPRADPARSRIEEISKRGGRLISFRPKWRNLSRFSLRTLLIRKHLEMARLRAT